MRLASVWMFGLIFLAGMALGAQEFTPRPGNQLALTPPMGWNSWNKFGCDISEMQIKRQADAMVASGLKSAGYEYILIDDCWHGSRDAGGAIQADSQRFPGGMKALGDYLHEHGLKFGIYSDAGEMTCQDKPGSRGHEYQDALTYAAWGVDYLKYDWCHAESVEPRAAYETMSDALRATGRPIVFSVCEWGSHEPWLWAASIGANLWRTGPDIYDTWSGDAHFGNWLGVTAILDRQVELAKYAGPGHWNDPDMLEVGNGGMTAAQYRAHFSLWAMLAAPLIAGNDLASMTDETRRILTNREVIAVDQDALGMQAQRVLKDGDAEIWVRPLSGGATAVLFLNRGPKPASIRFDWRFANLKPATTMRVRDLWAAKDLAAAHGSQSAEVPPTSAVLLKLAPAP